MALDFEMDFSLSLRRDEGHQLGKALAHAVGCNAELFDGQTETVDPESCVAEPLGTGHIPTAKSRKRNLLELQTESSDPHLIRARIGFVSSDRVRAQHMLVHTLQARVADPSLEHTRCRVGQ